MNILYGIAFLVIIYYIFQWKKNTKLLETKLIQQTNSINNNIQDKLSKVILADSTLIEGFNNNDDTNTKLFKSTNSQIDSTRNNCNSMFLPSSFKGVYDNEISNMLFNYAITKKRINL